MADYIDRDKAITAIEECIRVGDELYPITDAEAIMNHAFEVAASCVYNLPSADVKPVTRSEWVYLGREEVFDISGVRTWGARYQCRSCGFEPIFIEDHGIYDFCPNCGSYNGGGEYGDE